MTWTWPLIEERVEDAVSRAKGAVVRKGGANSCCWQHPRVEVLNPEPRTLNPEP